MATREELLNRSLPKWPALAVVGEKITENQAAEILIRTDRWYFSRNDPRWYAAIWRMLDVPLDEYGNPDYDARLRVMKECRVLDLDYLCNDQIASSSIGGPHGWCDWQGNIGCNSFNIGKWPRIEDIDYEWRLIAEAFPYLKLRAQVYNCAVTEEREDKTPVVEWVVENGQVELREPTEPIPLNRRELEELEKLLDFCIRIGRFPNTAGCTEAQFRKGITLARMSTQSGGGA